MRKYLALAALLAIPQAHAVEVLSFGQNGTSDTVFGLNDDPTKGSTLIETRGAGAGIIVTSCLGCTPLVGKELLTISATSIGEATRVDGFIVQSFSGSFSIMDGTTNVLSGKFTDAIFGSGTSLTLSASNATPGQTLSLTSSVIPTNDLKAPMAMSLSFADINPPVNMRDGTLSSFAGSVAGTFSATPASVPEPASLYLLLAGVAGVGVSAWRRRRK